MEIPTYGRSNALVRIVLHITFCLLLVFTGKASWAQRSVNDLAGRPVALPERIVRAATLGAVAPLNSFLFMLGKPDVISNGMPAFFQTPYWSMQRRLGPHLVRQPIIAGSDGLPNIEALLALAPDVVLTSSRGALPVLETAGLPALHFEWKDFDDLRRTAELLGDVLGARTRAAEFLSYCNGNVARVAAAIAAADAPQRPRVAFLRAKTFSQPARIADWTLAAAGGDNVGRISVGAGQAAMTLEALLRADPETLIVWSREERDALLADPRFAAMSAVRARRVHAVPVGATPWLAPGAEQCLGVLWTAQRLYPERFADLDLVEEVRGFYHRFFSLPIDAGEAAAIIDGMD